MLKQRIITALVLLPVVFLLLFSVRLDFFAGLILIVVYLMALEWAKLSEFKKTIHWSFFALSISFVNLAIWYFSEALMVWPSLSWPHYAQMDLPLLILFVALFFIFLSVVIVLSFSSNKNWWQSKVIKSLFGLVLLPAFFVSFVSIRQTGYPLYGVGDFAYGGKLLLFMLLLIWAADTGAFVTGKIFGKHKLTKVSPNKTWEGVIGGISLSVAIGWAGISVLDLQVNNMAIYLLVILSLAIASVFGDLFESALKRVANIKDSGNLLPGHGGLLDRLDSTITVAPLFYLSFSYFEWFNG
jgi:phosphatidate cytidylyltransferase